jgi:hypothetical protein
MDRIPIGTKPVNEMIDRVILAILGEHQGLDNRISRADLLREVNEAIDEPIHDRRMRGHIEELRRHSEEGAWICSSLDGGYFLAGTLQELQTYLDSEESRLAHLAKKIARQRKVAGLPLSGQIALMGE